jgi:hypothetical protein
MLDLKTKMKVLIFTIYSFLTISLYAQNQADLILIQEQNEKWFETLEQLSLPNQIDFLNKRLMADTNIFVPSNLDRVHVDKLDNRQVGFCKPIIVAGGIAEVTEESPPRGLWRKHSLSTRQHPETETMLQL